VCSDCRGKKEEEIGRELTDDEISSFCLFETYHGFDPSESDLKEAMECPDCEGHNTQKSFIGVDTEIMIRGIEWSEYKKDPKNKAAIDRDMQIHTLRNNDPYASMRQDGEKEHLESNLEKSKTKDKGRLYFT